MSRDFTTGTLNRRRSFYEDMDPPIDYHEEVAKCVPRSAKTVVDVGCGDGDLLAYLRTTAGFMGRLIGYDRREDVLRPGVEKSRQEGLGLELDVGDIMNLPLESESFDVIITKFMLHFVEDVQGALSEVNRCLRTGGTYIAVIHGVGDKPYRAYFLRSVGKLLGYAVGDRRT